MRKRFLVRMFAGAALLGSVSACGDDPLSVPNLNNPDVDRVLASIGEVEAAASRTYQQMHQGMYGTSTTMWPITMVQSFESAANLANFSMNTFGTIQDPPNRRATVDNSIGNGSEQENERWFSFLGRNARNAARIIDRIDALVAEGAAFGDATRNARAKAFAYFALGYATGHMAMMYDQLAVTPPGLGPEDVPEYVSAADGIVAAVAFLDEAFAVAGTAAGQSIPNTGGDAWIPTASAISMARLQQIIRSFQIRFLVAGSRKPSDPVDWARVIQLAPGRMTSDLVLNLDVANGWTNTWISQALVESTWHQLPYFIAGMADTSPGRPYETWLAAPLGSRHNQAFLIVTPDQRFPQGATREAQQLSPATTIVPPSAIRYIRNRPGGAADESAAKEWRFSFYDVIRFGQYRAGVNVGPWLTISEAEGDLLVAEANIRTGNVAAAVTLINKWRTRAGLPTFAPGTNDVNTVVPGAPACVPRVPSPAPNTTCGNVFEALKWELRMETVFAGAASWYVHGRRWGDLIETTPLEWPVPYTDLLVRNIEIYHVGAAGVAGPNTYGF